MKYTSDSYEKRANRQRYSLYQDQYNKLLRLVARNNNDIAHEVRRLLNKLRFNLDSYLPIKPDSEINRGKEKPNKTIRLRIYPNQHEILDVICERCNVSKSFILRKLIEMEKE